MFRSWIAVFCLTFCLSSLPKAQAQADGGRPELRAFWVDGFNEGFKTPAQCDTLLARVRAAHGNAVFVQMRKRADAYYASHYEPWANDDPGHFDALDYLCRAAHAPGQPRVQVHAWINACAIGGNKNPDSITKKHPEWFSLSDNGADYDQEATKIDPGNPAAADWTYRVYLDVARHYPVDGIHFDFIRYGGSGKSVGHWGYNAVSIARYQAATHTAVVPLWNDPQWQQWRRDQVAALVRRVYANVAAIRPDLIVSAATICWGDGPADDAEYETKSAAYTEVYASWRDWLREGILDLNCPMTYFQLPQSQAKLAHWETFIKDHQYGRLSAMGCANYLNSLPNTDAQIGWMREPTALGNRAAGIVFFSYATTDTMNKKEEQYNPDFYSGLSNPALFPADVPVPPMPWKTHPTAGIVKGLALQGESLTPLDSAAVTLKDAAGVVRTATADGNGFFAFVGAPPGDYELTLPAAQPGIAERVHVTAGNVVSVTPGLRGRHVAGLGQLADGAGVVLTDALVTSGSDKLDGYFYIADGFGKAAVRVNAPGLSPPVIMGDRIVLSGTLTHSPQGLALRAAAVRHLGAVLVRPVR